MTEALATFRSAVHGADRSRRLGAFLLLAWFALCTQLLAMYWEQSAWTMPDADDAMRLVQVREFLAGHGWFDLHEARLSPPLGYDSHWSRFIDVGLAGLYLLFRAFADQATAERLMAVTWPMLWLLPAMASVAAIARRLGGRDAAFIVLLLAAFCGPGMQQFRPGRIDHHNIHIALSLAVVAATVWSDRLRWAAWVAGALSGLALAIGFENLPFLMMCGAAFGLRYIVSPVAARALREYGLALAASTLAIFLCSVPPSRWTHPVCDMIAINSAFAVIAAGLAVAAASRWRSERLGARIVSIGLSGALAAAIFLAIEPRCSGGVYAMVDPAIRPIWLDHVSETKPMLEIIQRAGASGLGIVAFPAVALIAAFLVVRRAGRLGDFGLLAAWAAFLLSIAYMMAANRGVSYAVWLGAPFVAAALGEAFSALRWSSVALRFAVTLMLTPTAITVATVALASAAGERQLNMNSAERQACVRRDNFAPLLDVPKGLVAVNELEWGPYVLAWSPHSVLAAPYHRIPEGIVASYRIFNSPPDQAHQEIDKHHVDYLFVCGKAEANQESGSLIARLQAGAVPDWLKVVAPGSPAIYRVQR
jgi:hypothetical protein